MIKLGFLLGCLLLASTANAEERGVSAVAFEELDRTIRNEPEYKSKPKYCLVLLGASGNVRVWMVEDGKQLYVDKNSNGDLTDDGPPIEPSNFRKLAAGSWDFNYLFDAVTERDGTRCTYFNMRRWNYGEESDSYGLSLTLNSRRVKGVTKSVSGGKSELIPTEEVPMYAGWFDTFWSNAAESAPVIHFGGPMTPKLLRSKHFVINSKQQHLSIAFTNPGSGPGAVSRLSIDAVPISVVPQVTIVWPTGQNGETLQTSHELDKRCCYWEFYAGDFTLPKGVSTGTAKVSVEFPNYKFPLELTTNEIEVAVVDSVEGD